MKKIYFNVKDNGFYGAYYPCKIETKKAMIIMLGDDSKDRLAVSGAKWLHKLNCNVMAMSPGPKDYGHHNYPLERFEKAIEYLKSHGNEKIGIVGVSTTAMLALVAASYYNDITLTIVISPCDFVMEGFYQDGLDGAKERPGNGESTISYNGKPLPYMPYAYRHPEYWQKIEKESKESHNIIASREMFLESERLHPIQKSEEIKVGKISGKIIFIGAEDDTLWDTCRYIRRMVRRLKTQRFLGFRKRTFKNRTIEYGEYITGKEAYTAYTYQYGTHFVFPQSMIRQMFPLISGALVMCCFESARKHPKECKETRKDIDKKLKMEINKW